MTKAYNFDPTILREYDVRGQVGINLGEDDAYALGCSFGTYIKRNGGSSVAVGYDGRISSPSLSSALIKGFLDVGVDVDAVGLGPTPMLYFAVKDRKKDAGVMVTGSHNPSDYNGFKMTMQNGPIFGDEIQKIGQIAASGDFEDGKGSLIEIDIQDDYVERLLKDLRTTRSMKIAWDAGNGSSGEILRRLTRQLPGEHILLYDDIDGNFPNHHPDPTVDKNLVDLQKTVMEYSCDLGIAFDGDGDRIGVVNEKADILRCDVLMSIYAKDVLERNPGAPIIGDVKCSQVMFDEIARLGGTPIMWNTGHSLVKAKMAETKAPLAGELSGHIFFADGYYGFDDALYCAVRLLNALDGDVALSSLTAHIPVLFNTPEIRIEVDEEKKFDIVPQILETMREKESAELQINDIDGIRVTTPDGWWLIRPSNTQNVLVARVEASSESGLAKLKEMVDEQVKKIGYDVSFD